MQRALLRTIIVTFFLIGVCAQAQIQVYPTGNCPDDVYNVQSQLTYSWGNTVQLMPGVFNFSCIDQAPFYNTGVFAGYPGQYQWYTYHLAGTPGETIISGPGAGTPTIGIEVASDHVAIEGITFSGFRRAIRVGDPVYNFPYTDITIANCTFTQNYGGVFARPSMSDLHLLNNTFHLSTGQNAVLILDGAERLLAIGNTIDGPGPLTTVKTVQDLLTMPLSTFGIFQQEAAGGSSSYGRISNNKITGVDAGIQSSSNGAVVSGNVVANAIVAISISNDNYDGVSMVRDNLVIRNQVTHNQLGIWVNAGQNNIIESNDAAGDKLGGVVFLSMPGNPDNSSNVYFHNTGSVSGMPRNQGKSSIHLASKD